MDRMAGLVQVTDFRIGSIVYRPTSTPCSSAPDSGANRRPRPRGDLSNAASSIHWNAALPRAVRNDGSSGDQMHGVEIPDPDAFVRALAEQGLVRTIASPRMITLNNEPAALRVGLEDVYAESYASAPGTGGHAGRVDLPPACSRIDLDDHAQVSSDANIQLGVAPSYASRIGDDEVCGRQDYR